MKRRACVVAILLFTGACSASEPSEPDPMSETTSTDRTPTVEELVAAPGRIGPVLAGMSVDDAKQTGYFEAFKTVGEDPCKDTNPPIQWKAPYFESHTVRVDGEMIASLGVRSGTKTDKGIGVDATLAEVEAAYSGAKISPSQALGSTVYVQDGDKWLGLAFNEEPDEIEDSSKVTFMEVSLGSKPATYLSGCS